jgi:predicted metal-dependent enzyme (double-stranded beta helix superfamily)
VRPGDVLMLDRDVIHCIENPGQDQAHALHLYSGDFGAITHRRSLWSWDDHEQKSFSFPELLKESATAMHRSDNQDGLQSLTQAIPASKPMVDALTR